MDCENCQKCYLENNKSIHCAKEEKKALTKRLNIIEGQVRGVKQMIESDRYCNEILIQIAAISKSLQTLGNNILESYLKKCVVSNIKLGNLGVIGETMGLIKQLEK